MQVCQYKHIKMNKTFKMSRYNHIYGTHINHCPLKQGCQTAARGPNPARHALFCGPCLSNFIAILDVTELRLLIP